MVTTALLFSTLLNVKAESGPDDGAATPPDGMTVAEYDTKLRTRQAMLDSPVYQRWVAEMLEDVAAGGADTAA